MKITEYIQQADKPLFSFEILPPLKGQSLNNLLEGISPLMEFNPPFVDVTYHREEFIYKKHPNGLLEKVSTKKRPGTVGICAALMNRFHVDAVPHLLCGGFTKEEAENDGKRDESQCGCNQALLEALLQIPGWPVRHLAEIDYDHGVRGPGSRDPRSVDRRTWTVHRLISVHVSTSS